MSTSDRVVCGRHGSTPATFVCRHLAGGVACGFQCSGDDPTDRWPDAWCDACEELRAADRDDDVDIKVICTHCWEAARARNEHVPLLARGRAARLTDDEREALIHGAVHATQAKQVAADARWNIGLGVDNGKQMSWYFDSERRNLTFSEGDTPYVVADVRLVGSYSTRSDSFQWSWVLYPGGDPMTDGIDQLRGFGEARGLDQLTDECRDCEIADAWEMTALAAYLLDAAAVYRAPFEHLYWFMLLDNFRYAA